MAREGIYVGSNEVIQRYVGTRLVWEKVTIQFDEILRFTSNRFGSFWRFGSTERAFIDLGISERRPYGLDGIEDCNVVKLQNSNKIFEVRVVISQRDTGYSTSYQRRYNYQLFVIFKNTDEVQDFISNKYNETYIFGRKRGG
ncbi:hypothetical protein M060_08700 [Streptococcus mitis 29/42]|jgi:hypothetical protein|uniref:Uncharacterized protein n=2 Tax=Bacteria TaxID=2 RepID=S7YZD9_STRMT|nr:hypothetical protein M060_08700 [Streptococcus mitis 29/42]DAM77252.1 MAG TPA: hypothetical protein [Caudoviricetes sp.]